MNKKYFLICMSILVILSINSILAASSYSGSFRIASSPSGQIQIVGVYCGNNIVDSGEQCDKNNLNGQTCTSLNSAWTGTLSCKSYCVYDTSSCSVIQTTPAPSSDSGGGGGSSGGGGGGSSGGSSSGGSVALSSGTCIESWQCSQWSSLDDQCGTRSCTDSNKCGTADLKPVISKECSSTGVFGITGAAIGSFAKSGEGIATLTGLIVIIAFGIFITSARKKKSAKSKNP